LKWTNLIQKITGYDPVTTSDKAFEKFIRSKIKKKFPTHQVIGEEFGHTKSKSDFTWVIDPIDGTRSFVIGNPTWSNLISAGGYISTWDNRDAINAGNILVSSNKTMHNKFLKLLKPVSK